MQKMIDTAKKNDTPISNKMKQDYSNLIAMRKQMTRIIKDKKQFLQQPLDDYHFMTFSPESARIELNGKKAYGYWFEPVVENQIVINRKLPVKYPFTFQGITSNDDHTVHWIGQEPGGMSGTPLIIKGYVVGLGSGEGATGLLTDDFTNFLKRYMGNDYVKGLCARSLANEEAITVRTQP